MSINIGDFLTATRETRLGNKKRILDEATKRNYFFLSRMFKNAEEKFKGGDKLVDHIRGETLGNASTYNPTQRFNVTVRDTLTPISVYWAFVQSHYPIMDEAAKLNAGNPEAFVDYVMNLEQGCVTDTCNKLEELLWATPNSATMEAASTGDEPRDPYSFLAFITRDGLAPSSTNGGVIGSDWTTLETVNVASKPWFKNQTGSYSAANPAAADSDDGLIPQMDRMAENVAYESPEPLKTYADSDSLQKQVIVTNTDGVVLYRRCLRAVNDQMARLEDPSIKGPQHNGVPIKKVAQLDEVGWTSNQPDFLFLNLGEMYPFFHPDKHMDETITPPSHDHPNKHVVWKWNWMNVVCRSRRRQGRLYAA